VNPSPKPTHPNELREPSMSRNFYSIWGNCGETVSYLIERVHNAGGNLVKVKGLNGFNKFGRGTFKKNSLDGFLAIFQNPPQNIQLIRIAIDGIHEFVLELHPNGDFVLHQGYQGEGSGSYNAFWWADIGNDEDTKKIKTKETPKSLDKLRNSYGKSQVLNFDTLSTLLGLMAQFLNESNDETWDVLPFLPGGLRPVDEYDFQVEVWEVLSPEVALEAIHDGGPFLTTGVLREAWEDRNK
jgi:hypothetical protein